MAIDKTFHRKEAESHLRWLGRRHGIAIRWVNGRDWQTKAYAHGTARLVTIPKPRNIKQMLVALHEFGHLLGPIPIEVRPDGHYVPATKLGATPNQVWLLKEMAAWAWAIENIPESVENCVESKTFDQVIGHGLATHSWTVWTAVENSP